MSRQLTIIATIFLPLSFVTGFFGRNFGWMVNAIAGGPQVWFVGVRAQILTLAALFAYFRYKRWFSPRRIDGKV